MYNEAPTIGASALDTALRSCYRFGWISSRMQLAMAPKLLASTLSRLEDMAL
jgi:hypothetical protein